jgi:hypothetical protein
MVMAHVTCCARFRFGRWITLLIWFVPADVSLCRCLELLSEITEAGANIVAAIETVVVSTDTMSLANRNEKTGKMPER